MLIFSKQSGRAYESGNSVQGVQQRIQFTGYNLGFVLAVVSGGGWVK